MTKPRLAIPVVVQFGVRYVLRTGLLEMLRGLVQPVIYLGWEDALLQEEFEALGAEVYLLPKAQRDTTYTRIKRQLDMAHTRQIASPTTPIDKRRSDLLAPLPLRARLRDAFYTTNLAMPWQPERVLKLEAAAMKSGTNFDEFRALLRKHHIDAIFNLTPFYSNEQLLLRAAADLSLPICTSILSFDNLTTRGYVPVVSDTYLLWNRYNEQELYRIYPSTREKHVEVVGAPQFDFYHDPRYLLDESTWRTLTHLPPDRPVILFGGGHYLIAYHEQHILKDIDDAIERGRIPHNPVILFRQHPNDPLDRWKPILSSCKHVIHDVPWENAAEGIAHTNIRQQDIVKLASTLAHSCVHVNTSSTLTIDGAIFDRPQIGPAYDTAGSKYHQVMRDLYLREHFLPITNSGGLAISDTPEALITHITEALENPAVRSAERKQMIREIITYDDGKAVERVNLGLRAFINRHF
ncbi:MAG: CDP-glycerol glycerophosphotransferase family protein [Anaerolineae bacterium]